MEPSTTPKGSPADQTARKQMADRHNDPRAPHPLFRDTRLQFIHELRRGPPTLLQQRKNSLIESPSDTPKERTSYRPPHEPQPPPLSPYRPCWPFPKETALPRPSHSFPISPDLSEQELANFPTLLNLRSRISIQLIP